MRVLVLGWEYPPAVAGGLGAACHGLTTALARRGHDVLLAVPDTGSAPTPRDPRGIRRIPIDLREDTGAGERTAAPLLSPYVHDEESLTSDASARAKASRRLYGDDLRSAIQRYTRRVVSSAATQDFDVVHAHDWMTIPAALRIRMATRRPVVLHVHSTSFDRSGSSQAHGPESIAAVERAGVRTADRVAAVSEYTRGVLVREYGAEAARIDVVHNAAPEPVERPVERVATPTDPPVVLCLGRLTRQKGIGFFLRAAARVHAERPDVRFVVAGSGEERAALVELAASLGIGHRTFFPGSVDDATRERLYGEATVFALTSISEPFGLTPLEALRRGTPSVITDASGVSEVLPSAPVVAPWDAAGTAEAILAIVRDPAYRRELVLRGERDVAQLTWERSAESLERSLGAALTQGAVPRPVGKEWARGASA